MIQIVCDNCERTFSVQDDEAGGKAPCPMCGDINRVPTLEEAQARSTPAPRPPASPRPVSGARLAAESVPTQPGESILAVVRTGMFRAHPFLFTLMVLMIVVGAGLSVVALTSTVASWLAIAGGIMVVVGVLWWIIWWAAPHRWVKLTITNKRSIRQEGIVMRKTSEVLHNHIRNVQIEQSMIGRVLNVGSISIDSAAGGEGGQSIEIHMTGIPKPYEVKRLIDQHRKM